MTTVEAEHAFTVYCQGKSCRDLYALACRENDVRPNTAVWALLPEAADYFDMQDFDFSRNYLGPTGVHCLLDVIRANKLLLRLSFAGQGADDTTVHAVVAAVRNHERLGVIDLSHNPDITTEVADELFKLMRENKMIVSINVRGTTMGVATQRALDRIGHDNSLLEANFFKGDFVRLKRTFCELDTEGSGRITVSALLTQIEIPQVATALEKRFSSVDEGGIVDGHLDMSEFLRFTYPGYSKIGVLLQHLKREDHDDATIVANWKTVVTALRRGRMEFPGLHLVRIHHREISLEEAVAFLRLTLEEMWRESEESETSSEGKIILRPTAISKAMRITFGAEFAAIAEQRAKEWGSIRITPTYTRLLAGAFARANPMAKIVHDDGAHLTDTTLDRLLVESAAAVATETTILSTRLLQAKLLGAGIGGSIGFTFPEWFCFINELHDIALYPVCRPRDFNVEDALGRSPIQDSAPPMP
jgi:hypothetical protein